MNFRKDSPEIDITSPDVPMFGELPRENQSEILRAWKAGKKIGFYNPFKDSWLVCKNPPTWFDEVRYRVMED